MKFYTNVFTRGDKIFVRGYEDGVRVQYTEEYKPYLFLPSPEGKYSTHLGIPVTKKHFGSIKEARQFIDQYKDIDNFQIYGLENFTYTYIYDNYHGEINYDPSLISVVSLDLECKADEGFPNIELADKEITAITIRKKGMNIVFGCGDFHNTDNKTKYYKCYDESALLKTFLTIWNNYAVKPDIVTGWNIEFFDIPYLVNRIRRVCGDEFVRELSPWKIVQEKKVVYNGKESQTYNILGISSLDYYQVYRKFKFGNQESYKLDYIAQVELGEQKIDYSEYGSLLELYKNNYQKFIEYNIHDVVLVDRLEEKLKFIEQIMAFAYDAKVNYIDTMTTVRPWDVIIHNYLMDRRIVVPPFKKQEMPGTLVGGYVKTPKVGLTNWVVSFDLDSLYPHLIMQYNIGPETYKGKLDNVYDVEELLNPSFMTKSENSVAGNGCMYSKEKQGFLAALMEKMYNDRKEYKNKMLEYKKKFEETKDPKYNVLSVQCHNMQLAKKIQLNSAYGALGNEYFRWFNFNHAEAITKSGQLSIRWIETKVNEYMNNLLKTKNEDYVIASDTDSIYINMEKLVEQLDTRDEKIIVSAIDKFCELKIQPFMDKSYKELAIRMNAFQQKMRMKRETIANKGIWKAKKMYILNAWNIEGVQFDEPVLKIQGIEAVRSSTPQACRKYIKNALKIIMNKTEDHLQDYIAEIKDEYKTLSFEEIAFPRGVNNLEKYYSPSAIYIKGTPIHVKASLLFNHVLKKNKLNNIEPIRSGDKIKFCYMKMPNPIGEPVIANVDYLPKSLDIHKYIDYDLQFESSFIDPLKSITNVIDWEPERKRTLDKFFV